jgi:signal peptidase I
MPDCSPALRNFWSWTPLRAAVDKRRSGDAKAKPAESSSPAGGSAKSVAGEKSDVAPPPGKHTDAFRETVESVVIAFVLAFLFRTFLAEAFVIPTGSMAPTLMGRHKDYRCEQCGCHYTVGASDEVDKESNLLTARLTTSVCPNCAYTNDVYDKPVFNGDRILVNKFNYELGEPDRFDVFVFRYPEDPQTNYIKRLVGLPGESIKIERGDLYARKGAQGEFRILRKDDPYKQRLLQQLVYDDDHPPRLLLKHGWPERWAPMQPRAEDNGDVQWTLAEGTWRHDADKRTFELEAAPDWNWLRYRHLVPSERDWDRVLDGHTPTADPLPQLITDFCGYNAHRGRNVSPFQQWEPELFWVGDLTLNARLDVRRTAGEAPAILLELVEGVRRYRCEFDLLSGMATLSRTDELKGDGSFRTLATAETTLSGTGRHDVTFANVDDRLCLWVDGRLVDFGAEAEYAPPPIRDPQTADLLPVGIAARGVDIVVSRLVLQRDIYYRAQKSPRDHDAEGDVGRRLADLLTDPAAYSRLYNQETRSVEFDPLDDDEYFPMGDNSSRSYDGRLWRQTPQARHAHAVNRRALIGKAFFVYWPHGVPFLNDGKGFPIVMHSVRPNAPVENYPLYTVPFYPQWWRWSRIR